MRHPENMQNLCVCGHERWKHYYKHEPLGHCYACLWHGNEARYAGIRGYENHLFKLDNLKLIEELAKEKGLL